VSRKPGKEGAGGRKKGDREAEIREWEAGSRRKAVGDRGAVSRKPGKEGAGGRKKGDRGA
jgi:hypothetical protein